MDQRPKPEVDLVARCACGGAGVAVKGRIRSMLMCSCLDCQRATGTGHATVAIADAGDVTVTGTTKSFARPANSGAIFTRWFCPVCGSPLYGKSSRTPDFIMLPVGLFGPASEWFVPSQLIFARSHHDWDTIAAELPRHRTYRNEGN